MVSFMALQSHTCYNVGLQYMPFAMLETSNGSTPLGRLSMVNSTTPRFYVYVLCRPNGTPFYVGKGSGRRIFEHDSEARSGHKCHKCNVIRKIWKQGGEVQRYTVFETDDEQEAFAYECELIAMYGHSTLTNITSGGQGSSGRVFHHSDETKARIKELRKQQDMTRQSEALKKRLADDVALKQKMLAPLIEYNARPDVRAERSTRMKLRWQTDPDLPQKFTTRGRTFNDETRQKMRLAQSERRERERAERGRD